jgi:hypothetical protein
MSTAWYHSTRADFLRTPRNHIADQLATCAANESLAIEPEQAQEWDKSVALLQETLDERLPILRKALEGPGTEAVRDVILEYDFRRRGLRMDCVLLADGVVFVLEFKRSKVQKADRDQVMGYAVNLVEFHKVTREWCDRHDGVVAPILVRTTGSAAEAPTWPGLGGHSWRSIASSPLQADADSLGDALRLALANRRSDSHTPCQEWLDSPFKPSSSIIDATVSLYGNHDVAAIAEHAAPQEAIERSVAELRARIHDELSHGRYHIIFLSGAPGAGKTLVGLDLVMRGETAGDAVFVTGNAPLVDVLNQALKRSYTNQTARAVRVPTGYRRRDVHHVVGASSYKIVKAHRFLGDLTNETHRQEDGRILVFDEAQRTYKEGTQAAGRRLPDHEADLILALQQRSYPRGGAILVALIGHNQAINKSERGMIAWLEAAERLGWTYSVSDRTLADLPRNAGLERWRTHPGRRPLRHGHLAQSMRFYRNSVVEQWATAVLDGPPADAARLGRELQQAGCPVLLTRGLNAARAWARSHAVGEIRAGIVASAQAKRLAAEGLFVDYVPDIANWMLAPSSDVRSSTFLETVQNQFQVQGLELDYSIVCWDADLRRDQNSWAAYKFRGADWQGDGASDVVKNSYRVLLTRARKGMVIFVPRGDLDEQDETRDPAVYDRIASFLEECGAQLLD